MSVNAGNPNSAKPTTAEIVGGTYNAVPPVLQDGQAVSLQTDVNGKLLVAVAGSGATSNVNIADINGIPPALTNPLPVELSDGTNAVGTAGNPLSVNVISGGGSPNVNLIQVGGAAISLGQALAAASLPVVLTAAQIATLTPLSTVAVTQSTSPWVVNVTQAAGVTLGATAVVAYGSTPAAVNVPAVNAFITNGSSIGQPGTLTNNNAAPTTTNLGVLPAIAETAYATATYTTGNQVLPVTDLHGALNQDLQAYAGSPVVTDGVAGLIPVGNYGTNATTDATWTSATSINTAVTLVSNIEGYSSIAITLNQTGTLTAGALTFEISNDNTNWYPVEGVDPNTGVIIPSTYTLTIAYVIYLFTVPTPYFRVRLSTAIVGSGTLIVGHNVKSLPQIHNIAGTISGSFGAVANQSAPAPANGATVPLQSDFVGSLFIKPFRRSQTVTQSTTISASTSPTTILAAQAAGIFADLTQLTISVVPGATTDTAFTATLSDGTKSTIYSLDTGALATAVGVPTPLVISWPAAKPATTAATVWTLTLSSATPTVYIDVTAILQTAS